MCRHCPKEKTLSFQTRKMSKDVTQVNLFKKISQRKVCKLQIATILTLICQNWISFCLCRMLSIFKYGVILYVEYLVQCTRQQYSQKTWQKQMRPIPCFFLLIFNNTIIMRDYLCLCALQGCLYCFLCYNYSDLLVNLLNVIDSNPEQSYFNNSEGRWHCGRQEQ